ncbi:MAG: DUF423 domain-containing protein [Verrucomicrobia bacterium]|nr:DUF423 domain-containing protein [Verrucomicrobiota bacterium]MBV8640942.1 DUF423 domain-containing protein [Verrucomicrobiota bacterium]
MRVGTLSDRLARRLAGILGCLGLLFGVFGAHVLRSFLESHGTAEYWRTGVLYHLVQAVALLALSGWRPVPRFAFYLILAGVTVFSGSLYALALTNLKWFGAITPVGGLGMLSGWLVLALAKGPRKGLL